MTRFGRAVAWLRARIAARPDTEHEQALVRLALTALIAAYILPGGLAVFEWRALEFHYALFTAYFVFSVLILGWVLSTDTVSHPRRCIALAADIAIVSTAMWYFGEQALPLLLVYVWVTPTVSVTVPGT
jgi:two-component system sensor histidine kinase RpfC